MKQVLLDMIILDFHYLVDDWIVTQLEIHRNSIQEPPVPSADLDLG
jgi:hypothetical protein